MKRLFIAFFLTASIAQAQQGAPASSADAVNNACSQEAATAGCGEQKVGTGLFKCLQAYRKDHSDFKLSKECRRSMKEFRKERKAKKDA